VLFARSANFMGGKVSTLKYSSEANPAKHLARRSSSGFSMNSLTWTRKVTA